MATQIPTAQAASSASVLPAQGFETEHRTEVGVENPGLVELIFAPKVAPSEETCKATPCEDFLDE